MSHTSTAIASFSARRCEDGFELSLEMVKGEKEGFIAELLQDFRGSSLEHDRKNDRFRCPILVSALLVPTLRLQGHTVKEEV